MIHFANAKINLGLQVVEKLPNGYHRLETVFCPVPLYDVVEVNEARETNLIITGMDVPGSLDNNLCMKAYQLLKKDFDLPPVEIHLHKVIPMGAGLGGGSSDAAGVLKLLNVKFDLGLSLEALEDYAAQLGADCAFFIQNKPVYATGIGNIFSPLELDLTEYHLLLIYPSISVSTREAYQQVQVNPEGRALKEAIKAPVDQWKSSIYNDFEPGILALYPQLAVLKEAFYTAGALYAAMSGSGSALFGIFKNEPAADQLQAFEQGGDLQVFKLRFIL